MKPKRIQYALLLIWAAAAQPLPGVEKDWKEDLAKAYLHLGAKEEYLAESHFRKILESASDGLDEKVRKEAVKFMEETRKQETELSKFKLSWLDYTGPVQQTWESKIRPVWRKRPQMGILKSKELKKLEQAEAWFLEFGDRQSRVFSLVEQASFHKGSKRQRLLEDAWLRQQAIDDPHQRFSVLSILIEHLTAEGQYAEANSLLEDLGKLRPRLENQDRLASVCLEKSYLDRRYKDQPDMLAGSYPRLFEAAEAIPQADLQFDVTALAEALKRRIEEIRDNPSISQSKETFLGNAGKFFAVIDKFQGSVSQRLDVSQVLQLIIESQLEIEEPGASRKRLLHQVASRVRIEVGESLVGVYQQRGMHQEAHEWKERVRQLRETVVDRNLQMMVRLVAQWREYADVLLPPPPQPKEGEEAPAEDPFDSLVLLPTCGNFSQAFDSAPAVAGLAQTLLEEGRLEESLATYQLLADVPVLKHRAQALYGMARIYDRLNRRDLQGEYLERAVGMIDAFVGKYYLTDFTIDVLDYMAYIYRDYVDYLLEEGKEELAFTIAERARARGLLAGMGARWPQIERFLPANLVLAWKQAMKGFNELESGQGKSLIPGPFSSTARKMKANRRQIDLLRGEILKRVPQLRDLLGLEPMDYNQIQAIVPKDATLISYFTLEDEIVAWVVDGNGTRFLRLQASPAAIEGEVEKFREYLENLEDKPDFANRADEAAARIHDAVFQPLRAFINNDRLLIVPHYSLHYLPFAALRDSRSDRYLVQDYQIARIPMSSSLRYLVDRPAFDLGERVIFGMKGDSFLTTESEAREIAQVFGTQPIIGEFEEKPPPKRAEAEEKPDPVQILLGRMPKADLLHVAAHGVFDSEYPYKSHLKLGRRQLRAQQIYDMNLSETNLVVLSACNSSSGRLTSGDDVLGLSHAFIFAGTSSLISSLWKVRDVSTRHLMGGFYRRVAQGLPFAQALRETQLEMLADEHWSAPQHWSAFALTGVHSPLLKPSEPADPKVEAETGKR